MRPPADTAAPDQQDHPAELAGDPAHPVIDAEPVGTITEALLPAAVPDPDAIVAGDDDDRPYRGRRRLIVPTWTLRRFALVVIAVGVTLIATSAVAGLLLRDGETRLAPPPSPPERADPGPGGDLDQQGIRPSGGPSPRSPSPTPTARPVASESRQAEAAGLGDHAQVIPLDGAAGGEAVRLSGNREGTFVRFAGIEVAVAGEYELTISYLCDQDRSGTVSVNDGSVVPVSFPSRGEAGTTGSVTVPVVLVAGDNVLQVSSEGGAPLVIDQITVNG